jgi:hypothetical protein
MNRQPHTESREIIVANAIRDVVAELRMIDVGDYIAFMRMECFANVSDIVDSAAEMFFMPGTLRLGHGGEAQVAWKGDPRIVLDLELRPQGATVYFTLTLSADEAAVNINYVSFEAVGAEPVDNTVFLERAIDQARIRKKVPGEMAGEAA